MCSECRSSPCNTGCPNAPEPRIVYECDECRADIVEGEDYYRVGENTYCEDCVSFRVAEFEEWEQ